MSEMVQVGRLALRVEGEYWNAYYAESSTLDGAVLLGSIRMSIVQGSLARHERTKKQFMRLMRDVVADLLRDVVGQRPTWNEPVAAPSHERTSE